MFFSDYLKYTKDDEIVYAIIFKIILLSTEVAERRNNGTE